MKILLGAIIVACFFGIGFIDIGGAVLFAICGGYFAGWMYLIDHNKAFREFFYQLGRGRGNRYRWSQIGGILLYFGMVAAGFYLPDQTGFRHWQFGLIALGTGAFMFLLVFLQPIIRTKKALKAKS